MNNKLPIGWIEKRLDEIGVIVTGATPSTENSEYFSSDDVCFIKPDDLKENMLNRLYTSKAFLSNIGAEKSRKLPKGSVIVTCIGIIGKVGILHTDACFNQQINGIIVEPNIADPQYIGYCLLYYSYILKAIANAPVVPIINKTQFSEVSIPIPPLYEQKKIASILEKTESAIQKRNEADELADKYLQSIFIQMFGDPVTNSKGWQLRKLYELGEIGRGVSRYRPRNAPELLGGPYPLIQTGDVANAGIFITEYKQTYSEIGLKQSKMWEKGTLCITIAANIAKTSILTFNSCFPDSIVGFIANEKTNNIFIYFWFTFFQRLLEANAPESAQKNINLQILNELEVIVPQMELQKKFAEIVNAVEKLKQKQKQSTCELDTLFKSFLQKAFRGELTTNKIVYVDTLIEDEFNIYSLKNHIKAEFSEKQFTFVELFESISKKNGDFEYETLKAFIFETLQKPDDGSWPFLAQIFRGEDIKEEEKVIYYIMSDSLKV
jgi:type I restriction enzyme S subunit